MCNLSEAISEKTVIKTLVSLVEKGRLTKEEAAEEINMEVGAFEELMLEGANVSKRGLKRQRAVCLEKEK